MSHFICSFGWLLFRVALWLIAASLTVSCHLVAAYCTLGCLLFYVAMWRSLRGLLFHVASWLLNAELIIACRLGTLAAMPNFPSYGCSLPGLLFHVVMWLLVAGLVNSCRFVAVPISLYRLLTARLVAYCFMSPGGARCGAYCFISSCGCSLRGLLCHIALLLLAAGLIVSCRLVTARCGAYCFMSPFAAPHGIYYFMSPCGSSPRFLLYHGLSSWLVYLLV